MIFQNKTSSFQIEEALNKNLQIDNDKNIKEAKIENANYLISLAKNILIELDLKKEAEMIDHINHGGAFGDEYMKKDPSSKLIFLTKERSELEEELEQLNKAYDKFAQKIGKEQDSLKARIETINKQIKKINKKI